MTTKCFVLALIVLTSVSSHAFDRPAVEAFLGSAERDLGDKITDPIRKPLEVLEFLGIEQNMQVLDLYAAGGYYTVILSKALGDGGTVYAQNSPRALAFQEDRTDITAGEAIAHKIEAHQLANVVRMDESLSDLNFLPNSFDAVMVSLIFHDYYNRNPSRAQQMLLKLKTALKPGGVIGLIDHYGEPGKDNARFHRIVKQDVLRNPRDDYRRSIFDPMLNRHTDRFLLRVRNPVEH